MVRALFHIPKESNMVRKMALGFDVPSISHIFWLTHTPKAGSPAGHITLGY